MEKGFLWGLLFNLDKLKISLWVKLYNINMYKKKVGCNINIKIKFKIKIINKCKY